MTPPAGYLKAMSDVCKRHGALVVFDEVMCGLGRTGTWFGYQHYGIEPDFVTMAKGVASGYAAISCTVTTEAVFEMFKDDAADLMGYFRDISTFGGCTAGPVAALENMRIIEDEGLLANTAAMGERVLANLRALQDRHAVIGDVRGKSCILLDDIVDSGGTLCNAADALLAQGATDVSAYVTHGVLSGGAVSRIASSAGAGARAGAAGSAGVSATRSAGRA